MAEPYSIQIYVQNGDPNGLKIFTNNNHTGVVSEFPRSQWNDMKTINRFRQSGVYILIGSYVDDEDDDLPVVYIGQGSNVQDRIDSHAQDPKKEWWDKCVVITSSNNFLNTAHIEWLETNLHQKALNVEQCTLDNKQSPQKDTLSESETADMRIFMKEVLQILPLIGIYCFEERTPVRTSISKNVDSLENTDGKIDNMIVVAARKEGFEKVFMEDNSWHAVRIAGGRLEQIKYIAVYQIDPIFAITHYAPVESIELFGDTGKYRLVFSEPAIELDEPILVGDLRESIPFQRSRYTSLEKFRAAQKSGRIEDLFD